MAIGGFATPYLPRAAAAGNAWSNEIELTQLMSARGLSASEASTFLQNQISSTETILSLSASSNIPLADFSLDERIGTPVLETVNPASVPSAVASQVAVRKVDITVSSTASEVASQLPENTADTLSVVSAEIDPQTRRLTVNLENSATDEAVAEVKRRLPRATVRRIAPNEEPQLFLSVAGWYSKTDDGVFARQSVCSLGLVTTQGNLITAGHCTWNGDTLKDLGRPVSDGAGTVVGLTKSSHFKNGGIDRGLVGLYANRVRPGYYANYSGGQNRILSTQNTVLNNWVCKYGTSTGVTCGSVTQINAFYYSVTNGWRVNGVVRTSLCAAPGDSGAPVVMPWGPGVGVAVGNLSGGQNSSCPMNSGSTHPGTVWYTPIRASEAAYGQTVARG
ncbi:S1 family peptidase [Calidifontibacter terrae]